jgi:shikimate dehydrogenase
MPDNVIERIQPYLDNVLDRSLDQKATLTGIFGDRPSASAKSPFLWNPTFQELEMDAAFVPFDVSDANLPELVRTLKEIPSFAGGSVTVPHKSRIMDLLDDVDTKARQIGAVNAIVRTSEGRLIGYNTDAQGAIDSLKKKMPWQERPFLEDLEGLNVLLIGAGGAGRAVAFAIAEEIGSSGYLIIANRSTERSAELAGSVNKSYGNTGSTAESDIPSALPDVDLIINASLRGQSGLRSLPGGQVTYLEPYSSLAAANPARLSQEQYSDPRELQRAWYRDSLEDICENHSQSSRAILYTNTGTVFVDLIFSPLETTLLRQARLAGHATLNGKGMNLAQAVDAFVNRVMHSSIRDRGWDVDTVYGRIFQIMARVW